MNAISEAAERLSRVTDSDSKMEVYPYPSDNSLVRRGHAEQSHYRDLETCAAAYLAEHPAADDQAITVERLEQHGFRRLGGERPMWRFSVESPVFRAVDIQQLTTLKGQPWIMDGCTDTHTSFKSHPNNWGDVVRGCQFVGIELTA